MHMHMRGIGKLWNEALVRREAEEESVHGRRLRVEAHAAASGKLADKGEALKEELGGHRALMAMVSAVQAGAGGRESVA